MPVLDMNFSGFALGFQIGGDRKCLESGCDPFALLDPVEQVRTMGIIAAAIVGSSMNYFLLHWLNLFEGITIEYADRYNPPIPAVNDRVILIVLP